MNDVSFDVCGCEQALACNCNLSHASTIHTDACFHYTVFVSVPWQMFDNILSLRMVKNADDDLVVAAMHSAEAEVMEFKEPQVGADGGLSQSDL